MKTLTLFLSLCLITQFNLEAQNYAAIDVDSAYALVQYHESNPNFIILDVRRDTEYSLKHLENGVLLDYYMPTFSDILDTLIKDKIYLIHCASGGRSNTVFNMMQTKGYTDVFNMTGGINAWVNAGYPTLTTVDPILLSVSDSLVDFQGIETGLIVHLEATITNLGNDTLRFNSITDISGTAFASDFNIAAELTGLMDYTFKFSYSPIDMVHDSVVFQINSSGGMIEFVLDGDGIIVNVTEVYKPAFKLYPNPTNSFLNIERSNAYKNNELLKIYNSRGRLIISDKLESEISRIDLSEFTKGLYIVQIGELTRQLVVY